MVLKIKFLAWAVTSNGLNNVSNSNKKFPPDVGGIQSLMGGLAENLIKSWTC